MSEDNLSQASANNPVPDLASLMSNASAEWRVFDMGRKIQSINKAEFQAIENGTKPYPYPIQQKARFAIVFWDKFEKAVEAKKNPFIWFLQFDLDELSLLKLQQRDHYISLVIKELGSQLIEGGQSESSVLDNHPYSFTPDQNRQAAFNSKVKVVLKQPASMHYEHVQAYFSGQISEDKWQELTVQGLADFATRLDSGSNEADLIKMLPSLSVQTLNVLGAILEHEEISLPLTQALIELQKQAVADNDHEKAVYLLRCLAGSKSVALIKQQLTELLSSAEKNEQSLYIVIAGRFWSYLKETELLYLYFSAVADHQEPELFAGLFADLAAVPEVRQQVVGLIRDPNRPEAISRAVGVMFGR